jgi:hypothetical protein
MCHGVIMGILAVRQRMRPIEAKQRDEQELLLEMAKASISNSLLNLVILVDVEKGGRSRDCGVVRDKTLAAFHRP